MDAKIKNTIFALLAYREHSLKELRQKLKMREFIDADIEAALQQFAAQGLQSNERFAEGYMRMRITKGYGPLRIAGELAERGIQEDLIQNALAQYHEDFWLEQITKVYRKKFGSKSIKNSTEHAKKIRFLHYRGFRMDQIMQVVNTDT